MINISSSKRSRPWKPLTEDSRFMLYRIGAHSSWWGAFLWTVALTVVNLTHPTTQPPGTFQRMSGIMIILLIGFGIALGSALARMRLAETISSVFESGIKVATVLQTNVQTSACMIETDLGGTVQSVEHSEVIGWKRDSLIGKNLDILIPDRFLRQHQEGFKRFQNTGESRVSGATINVPVLTEKGEEQGMRLSVARLGSTFLGTLVPIGNIDGFEIKD